MQIQTLQTNYNFVPIPVMFNGDPIKDNPVPKPKKKTKKAAKKAPAKKAPYKKKAPAKKKK